jgi:pentatricopeptide repeat protein
MINALIECDQFNEAIDMFTTMQDNGIIPDTVTINTMMKLYIKVKEPENAIKVFSMFNKYNILADAHSFNTAMNAYIESNQFPKAIKLFTTMQENGIIPDTVTINTMMKLYIKVKEPENAIKVFSMFDKYNIEVDIISQNILINAYERLNRLDEAFKVIKSLKHHPTIRCDPYTFQPILKHFQLRGDKKMFYYIWDKMIDRNEYNVQPDAYLYKLKDRIDQFRGKPLNEIPCRFFQRTGRCRKGNECFFMH